MTREREIFLQALEQPIDARSAFVERATAGDLRLKEAVEDLLANIQADTFLENGAAGCQQRKAVNTQSRQELARNSEHFTMGTILDHSHD